MLYNMLVFNVVLFCFVLLLLFDPNVVGFVLLDLYGYK